MADVQPFRAVRYSGAAGSLEDLVAPPYDAVGPEERERLLRRSPYNVVRLTLPESVAAASRLYRDWLSHGILVQEQDPSQWLLVDRYVGPDGVERERRGVLVSLAAMPYEKGHVLPHERTYPRVRDERLELLRATRVQPEPILVLVAGGLDLEVAGGDPDLQTNGSRLWRFPAFDVATVAGSELLIADGHHRYESAVRLGPEVGGGSRIMALLVANDDPGLHVFPTHRVFSGRPDLAELDEAEPFGSLDRALGQLEAEPRDHSAAIVYRPGAASLLRGRKGELDVELVDRYGLDGIGYTPQSAEAVAAVDRGDADVAFLLRAPRVEDVFAAARRGERMPPKSTYFFPKPLSGLLFHPVEP
jgi:uncharacterized protein (DUF1015 family)